MNELYSRIEAECKNRGIKVGRMCVEIGIGKSVLSDLKSGRKQSLSAETLQKIAAYFGVSVDYLLDNTPSGGASSATTGVLIPVLGRVQAGIPVEAVEEILDYEEITSDMASHGSYFALCVRGDSMEPKISDGDVVIVRRQSDVESGDTAVVLVNGDDATVKKIKKRPEGLMLIPTNPDFEPMFYTNKEIKDKPVLIIGKVIELRAKF